MGSYIPHYRNNVPEAECPCCGESRPLDWFGEELKLEIWNKSKHRVERVIRYRKYVACWKCREIKRINTLNDPIRQCGDGLIGNSIVRRVGAYDLIG